MKLEIELEDPQICDGCSCKTGNWCHHYSIYNLTKKRVKVNKLYYFSYVRPEKCIKENGL